MRASATEIVVWVEVFVSSSSSSIVVVVVVVVDISSKRMEGGGGGGGGVNRQGLEDGENVVQSRSSCYQDQDYQ